MPRFGVVIVSTWDSDGESARSDYDVGVDRGGYGPGVARDVGLDDLLEGVDKRSRAYGRC